jgi:hypothetical protein
LFLLLIIIPSKDKDQGYGHRDDFFLL